MMADANYSYLSVHTFEIFTKAVAQPGGRNAINTSHQVNRNPPRMYFKTLQSFLDSFLSRMKGFELY